MKKIILLLSVILLQACSDGDIEVPSFEFNETVNTCGSLVLYRLNSSSTEALIIQLQESDLKDDTEPQSLSLSSNRIINYRIFDDRISSSYFCSSIPPTSPTVLRDWVATGGKIEIETTEIKDENEEIEAYEHKITLSNLILEQNEEKLVFETLFFGTYRRSI